MRQFYNSKFILIAIFLLLLIFNFSKTNAATFSKTLKFFILQEKGVTSDGFETIKNFTISIAEDSPQITSAFIEIKGSAKSPAPTTGIINVKLDSDPYTPYNLDILNKPQKFTIHHDITATISADFAGSPGSKNYTLYIRNDNFDTTGLSAKLFLTYLYTKPTGSLPISGEIISSTIDTEIDQGAAFNSILWNGYLNGGKVRLQLATSNSNIGPWIFKGPNCNVADYYESDTNTPNKITCNEHNNQKYFRYKIILCSNNCTGSGPNNPNINSVIVNWSP